MYIKAKQGYNIIINDINISLQSGKDYVFVEDDVFNSSNDAKKVMSLIVIRKDKNNEKKPIDVNTISVAPKKNKKGAVVMQPEKDKKQTNAVVFDPNNEADKQIVNTEIELLSDKQAKTIQDNGVDLNESQDKTNIDNSIEKDNTVDNIVDNTPQDTGENSNGTPEEQAINNEKLDVKTKKHKKN